MSQQYELVTFDQLDALTKGETMSRLDHGHKDWQTAQRQILDFECLKAMQMAQQVEVAANEEICGLQAVAQIPRRLQAVWRAKFLMEDEAANVKGANGYECWRDNGKDGFLTRFKKLNPDLFYKEKKKGNKITRPEGIVMAGKYSKIERTAA